MLLNFVLSLGDNNFVGKVPQSFGSLPNLQGGILPNSVANLSTQLSKLFLELIKYLKNIPIILGNIVLGMHYNQVKYAISTSFEKLSKL